MSDTVIDCSQRLNSPGGHITPPKSEQLRAKVKQGSAQASTLMPSPSPSSKPHVIIDTQSSFQHIQILEHPVFGKQLLLDEDLQISSSDYAYQNAMVSPLIGHIPSNSEVAILGGGDGGVLNQLLFHHDNGHLCLNQASLIDIDPTVISLCETYLPELNDRIAEHPVAHVQVADALAFIDSQTKSLDAVIYDLTMQPVNMEQSQEEFTQSVMGSIESALKPNGILSMQVCGMNETQPSLRDQACKLQELVPRVCQQHFHHFQLQQVYIPSFEMPWLFLIAQDPIS